MDWYYLDEETQIGPISESEFDNLVKMGRILSDTLVWHTGMENWQSYRELAPYAEPEPVPDSGSDPVSVNSGTEGSRDSATDFAPSPSAVYGDAICAECGNLFSKNDMIHHGTMWICARCKPVFVQKLKEGVALAGDFVYGGFWIRVPAKIIDILIEFVLQYMAAFFIETLIGSGGFAMLFFSQGIQTIITATFYTYFLGKFAATPGKMAFKLKVIRSDGSKITYGRALGRYFAEMLSGLILCIGYIMAGFDDQKRALHDRICDTRVIRQ